MPIVEIYKDERWPDYGLILEEPQDFTIEVSQEFYDEFKKVEKIYDDFQVKFKKLYEKQWGKD